MLEGYRFSHLIKVRYTELDPQMIVLNSNYLNYIVITNMELFRQMGISVTNYEEFQFDIALIKSSLEFKKSATLDDLLEMNMRIKSIGTKSYTAEYALVNTATGDIIFTASNVYVCYNPMLKKSMPIPQYVREKFEDLCIKPPAERNCEQ